MMSALVVSACDGDGTSPSAELDMSPSAGVEEGGAEPLPDMSPEPVEDMGETELDAELADMMPPVELDLEVPPLRSLSLNSVVPNRGSVSGGDRVQVIGTGFVEGMTLTFDRIRCLELEVESSTRARCTTPEGSLIDEPIDVVAYAERLEMGELVPSQVTLEGGFTYYVPLEVSQLSPARGPTSGGTRVIVVGQGFTEETEVRFGGLRALEVSLEPNGTLNVVAPPMEPGPVDVRVQNVNGEATLQEGYYYYDRLEVDQLTPPVGPISGGTSVLVEGRGLAPRSRISLGGRPAELGEATGESLTFNTPSADGAGPATLTLSNNNGELSVEAAFVYFDDTQAGLSVAGMAPQSGPLEGGQSTHIAGAGFSANTEVNFDGRAASCELINANVLRCVTPPGAPGPVRVEVAEGGDSAEVSGGYTYYEALELTSIFPSSGSVAGGTLVELSGRGFSPEMQVTLGEQPLLELRVIDELRATGVTGPAPASTVDVIASTPYTQAIIETGYQYFDPTSQYGGVWGEGLEASMNITVLNGGSFEPEPDVALLLITEDLLTLEGLTNAEGLATLSHPDLRGLGTLTAAKEGFEVTTIERVGVENVTVILNPQPEGMGAPPPGVPPATLRGTVRGLDLIPKPRDLSLVNIVVLETTHSQPSNQTDLPPPGPGALLYEDGPFEMISRLGQLSVVATGGVISRAVLDSYLAGEIEYWDMRGSLNASVMGVRRYVSARSGEVTEGLHVELDHELDFEFPVDFDNPPYDPASGLEYYAVLPRLSFGAEGFWQLPETFIELNPNLELDSMPRLEGWGDDARYFLINFAFSATSANNTPMSINIAETTVEDDGVFVTPFAPAAVLEAPLDGGALGAERVMRWRLTEGYDGPISPPNATVIEVSEPALGPPTPLWRYVVPPGVTEVEVPILSSSAGETGLGQGIMFLDVMPFVARGRFDYNDFTYLDINGSRWASYGVTSSVFSE
jgi:hypothetical protein